MNTIWSNYIQGPKTLYYSRKLRFDSMFREQYKALFGLEEGKKMNRESILWKGMPQRYLLKREALM